MEPMNVCSRMAHFRLIGRIATVTPKGISGEAEFKRAPLYAGLEAMAQLAALHVRQRFEFERHAFLLSVHRCQIPAATLLEGKVEIVADLRSQSSNAFRYDVAAQGTCGMNFNSALLIGTQEYDDRFPKGTLKTHYQNIFAALKA